MSGNRILTDVAHEYPDYLRDESRRTGRADSISFPETEADLKDVLATVHAQGVPVTVQGARTGITGGAVPDGGHVVNLSRMNRILGLRQDAEGWSVTVQPGVLLSELRAALTEKTFDTTGWSAESMMALSAFAGDVFFPPDPTEASASLGGMVACNASGAQSFLYGATRRYVHRLRVLTVDGSVLALSRATGPQAAGRRFSLTTDAGRRIEGVLPGYGMPDVKNAAGYFARDDMAMLDLFVGSEGTLGLFSEIELRLIPAPKAAWGIVAFLPTESGALRFVRDVRAAELRPAAIEFFDGRALDLLREQKATNPAFKDIAELPSDGHTAIYVEYHGDEEAVESGVMAMSEFMIAAGGSEEATWMADAPHDMQKLKDFRHAVPEAVNLLIDLRRKTEPGLTKLGTDLAVPDAAFEVLLGLYHTGLARAGLAYVMFGHIGDNHVHVNIIPRDLAEYERGKALYLEWARAVVGMGGTVSAEHGIGKLKRAMLEIMLGTDGLSQMRAVKQAFDPEARLNPGNLFES